MPVYFYHPAALMWLWLVPVMAGLFIYAAFRRRPAIRAFGAGTAYMSREREALAACAAAALTVLALARPAWNLQQQELQESGRDVVFLLDVSRSMLAEDLYPNRLEHAKTAVLECIEGLIGDRIGLVLFAGSAEIRCPLTVDYDYFRMALRQADPDSVAAGGTMIAHAIERTVDKLLDSEKSGMQDVILITDGEDLVEGADEIEAARLLDQIGARLIAIGIGDLYRGSRIVLDDEETGDRMFMTHDNTEVWTKLHSETLRRMAANVSEGIYYEVGRGPLDLAQIYRQVMENARRDSTETQVMERYEEKFHLFLGGAVLVLLAANRWKIKT